MGTVASNEYEDVRPLGEGAFGTVVLVRHKDTAEQFALKKIRLQSSEDRRLALQEAKTLFELKHENLIRAYSFYEKKHWFTQNKVGIILEYCSGGNLGTFLNTEQRVSEANILAIMFQVSAGLKFLHHKGILHRDIKPENLLLKPTSSEGRATRELVTIDGGFYLVKIADLGLLATLACPDPSIYLSPEPAREPQAAAPTSGLSPTGIYMAGGRLLNKLRRKGGMKRKVNAEDAKTVCGFVGTRSYMAPEVSSMREYAFPADIFSLGLVCLEMMLGRRYAQPCVNTIKELRATEYVPPLKSLCEKMLKHAPTARPTASQVWDTVMLCWEPLTEEQEEREEEAAAGYAPFKLLLYGLLLMVLLFIKSLLS